ncbi:MAG: VanZ family protein [Terrimicrobiaceae bacterium]
MEFLRSTLARILRCGPLLWTLFVIWLGILFFFSSSESPKDMPTLLPHQDKVIHFVFYAGGASALAGALTRSFGLRGAWLLVLTVLVLALAGALDEYNQQFVPGRMGMDPYDWAADISGAACGVVVLGWLRRAVEVDGI